MQSQNCSWFRRLYDANPKVLRRISSQLILATLLLTVSPFVSANSLSFGLFNQGIYSGTPPFNTTGNCSDPGDDCSDTDLRVRSADIFSFSWSISASGIVPGDPDLEAVILEQTIYPGLNAEIIFNEIPTVCLAPPVGPGGTNPLSSITDNGDGSHTLLCNLGTMGNGDQKSFTVPVRPLSTSFDGSTFSSTQVVYALDASGNKVVADVPYVDNNNYSISAAPAWDLSSAPATLRIGMRNIP